MTVMVAKQQAQKVFHAPPDEATLDEIIHALYVRSTFNKGEAQIRGGLGVSHRSAKKRLSKWLR